MKRPDETFFALQEMVNDLTLLDRYIYLPKQERRENDIDHSFTVAMLCWYICTKHQLPLDLSKILRYALVHDCVERYAGDVNTFASPAERQKKVEREQASLKRFKTEFASFPDMLTFMEDYEVKPDEESLFVWTVDKMQVLIMSDLDNWRAYREYGIDYDWFVEKQTELLQKGSRYCKEIYTTLFEYSKSTYYDQP